MSFFDPRGRAIGDAARDVGQRMRGLGRDAQESRHQSPPAGAVLARATYPELHRIADFVAVQSWRADTQTMARMLYRGTWSGKPETLGIGVVRPGVMEAFGTRLDYAEWAARGSSWSERADDAPWDLALLVGNGPYVAFHGARAGTNLIVEAWPAESHDAKQSLRRIAELVLPAATTPRSTP